jgi:hypothetical protein
MAAGEAVAPAAAGEDSPWLAGATCCAEPAEQPAASTVAITDKTAGSTFTRSEYAR